jgi:hypothetical protein
MLRGPGWPWQEHETLRGLFGPDRFSSPLRQSLGFDVNEAIACSEAVARLAPRRLDDHMAAARESAQDFNDDHPAYQWAATTLQGWQAAGPADVRALAITAIWSLNHVGDALLIDSESLAIEADVPLDAAAAFLSTLSMRVGQPAGEWFQMAESVRMHPFIEFADDAFLPTVLGNDLWALRGVFETVLKSDDAFRVHRSRWLERRATDLVRRALDSDQVYESVEYAYEDEDGQWIEGEIDGLVICGDTAVVVEAKGATMRPGARRGGEAFIKHLRDNLTKAAQQGTRARSALAEPGRVKENGEPIELPDVREVHPIVVTLDDLSPAAPVLWEFQGTRVMPEGVTIPWVVTLHELDLVVSTIEWPVQLVHFLRRRSRLNQRGQLIASDELDWWMHYLLVGLYFEDDPATAQIRLMSQTDPLDAWVLHERGKRHTPAPKPAMALDKTSRAFLDLICSERPPGWVPGACMFLDMSGEARKRLWKAIDKVRPRARERKRPQRCTFFFESAPDPMMVCAAVLPNDERERLSEVLEDLVDTRLAEHGVQRVLGIAITVASKRPYEALGILERKWYEPPPDPERHAP